ENIGIRIRPLVRGTRNIGIENVSAHVNVPNVAELGAAGATIPIDDTIVALDNTSGTALTLTSTPTIPEGKDGQNLTLISTPSNPTILQDEGTLSGSGLQLAANVRRLAQRQTIDLVWLDAESAWVEKVPDLPPGVPRQVLSTSTAAAVANTTDETS